ncbi:hypothetical protein AC249_AIPGENE12565 [Exaiptasia diaphana]|nr:hypothetical protein AC249_AIPGENE12565 [Exaiptasia diaphana]
MVLVKVFLLTLLSCLAVHGFQDLDVEQDDSCTNRERKIQNCEFWALKGWCRPGHDVSFATRKLCKRTCGLCNGAIGCVDEYDKCNVYPKSDCNDNNDFMKTNCRATCGFC